MIERLADHVRRPLTPEEDSIGDPDDDEIDDLLPADLWFRSIAHRRIGNDAFTPA